MLAVIVLVGSPFWGMPFAQFRPTPVGLGRVV